MKGWNKDTALLIAGTVFGLVAIIHIARIFTGFNLIIAREIIPHWVSYPGFFISAFLSVWMFKARATSTKPKKSS